MSASGVSIDLEKVEAAPSSGKRQKTSASH